MLWLTFRKLKKLSAPRKAFRLALREQLRKEMQPSPSSALWRLALAPLAIAVMASFGLGSYAYASPAVGEESILFPVKTSLETARGALFLRAEQKALYRAHVLDRRIAEKEHFMERGQYPLPMTRMPIEAERTRMILQDPQIPEEVKEEIRIKINNASARMRDRIEHAPFPEEQRKEMLQRFTESMDMR